MRIHAKIAKIAESDPLAYTDSYKIMRLNESYEETAARPREPVWLEVLRYSGPISFLIIVVLERVSPGSGVEAIHIGFWLAIWSTAGICLGIVSPFVTMGVRVFTCLMNFPFLVFGSALTM